MKAAGLIQLGLLGVGLFAVVAAVGVAVVYPLLRRRLGRAAPAQRGRQLLALSALPTGVAIGLTALCFLASAFDVLWTGFDHCPHHGEGHPHFCLVHAPLTAGSIAGWTALGTLATLFALRLGHRLPRMVRSLRALRQLARTAVFDRGRGVWIVESDVPLAVTFGLFRCRTFVSTALLDSVPTAQAEAVIEHERAHARRHDVLLKLVAWVLSVAHLPRARRALLADLELATEQACDEEAAERLGDRLRVAQALVAVERLLDGARARFGLAGVSFGGSSVVPRVEALLAHPAARAPRSRTRSWLTVATAGVVLLLLADPLHHITETILGLLTR